MRWTEQCPFQSVDESPPPNPPPTHRSLGTHKCDLYSRPPLKRQYGAALGVGRQNHGPGVKPWVDPLAISVCDLGTVPESPEFQIIKAATVSLDNKAYLCHGLFM